MDFYRSRGKLAPLTNTAMYLGFYGDPLSTPTLPLLEEN